VLEHDPSGGKEAPLVLIGKGVTFDSGGVSIKGRDGLGAMKSDMAGAAAVLGAMRTLGRLRSPRRVVAIVPATENMLDAHAYRPADVLTAANGVTIEIVSTDAEGRLLLADALVYAQRLRPEGRRRPGDADGRLRGGARPRHRRRPLLERRLPRRPRRRRRGRDLRARLAAAVVAGVPEDLESDVADLKNSSGKPRGAPASRPPSCSASSTTPGSTSTSRAWR
jgi:leucyl aminopeptidase